MIRYKYNQQVSPPAPSIHVTIRRPGDEVLANRDELYVLLGRDVLNRHRIVLDGPQLVLEID
jgi:hypothetical protein